MINIIDIYKDIKPNINIKNMKIKTNNMLIKNNILISFENLFKLNVTSMKINIIIEIAEMKVSKSINIGINISINLNSLMIRKMKSR